MHKLLCLVAIALCISCTGGKQENGKSGKGGQQDNDSTLYGVCGIGTTMHTLQLVTSTSDTLTISLLGDEDEDTILVAGGLMAGDRMAVTAGKGDYGLIARRVVNITSLLGRWTSLDRDFEIAEDGAVNSNVEVETSKWTEWRIFNGHLLLSRDTFDIIGLTADSLDLENRNGIYSFRRVTAVPVPEKPDSLGAE